MSAIRAAIAASAEVASAMLNDWVHGASAECICGSGEHGQLSFFDVFFCVACCSVCSCCSSDALVILSQSLQKQLLQQVTDLFMKSRARGTFPTEHLQQVVQQCGDSSSKTCSAALTAAVWIIVSRCALTIPVNNPLSAAGARHFNSCGGHGLNRIEGSNGRAEVPIDEMVQLMSALLASPHADTAAILDSLWCFAAGVAVMDSSSTVAYPHDSAARATATATATATMSMLPPLGTALKQLLQNRSYVNSCCPLQSVQQPVQQLDSDVQMYRTHYVADLLIAISDVTIADVNSSAATTTAADWIADQFIRALRKRPCRLPDTAILLRCVVSILNTFLDTCCV